MKFAIVIAAGLALASSATVSEMDMYIEELNNKIPNGQWVAGKNFDSMDDVIPLLGALEDPNEVKIYLEDDYEDYQAPESFDSRKQWANCKSISKVWDQANCGSCWAVAAAGAMSDRLCVHKNVQTMVSAENLMDCCSTCGFGCNGGYPGMAWRYWQTTGLVSGGLYGQKDTCQPYSLANCDHHVKGPYGPCPPEVDTPSCKHLCTNKNYKTPYAQDKTHAKSHYNVRRSQQQIMKEIQTNGPVEASFTVYDDFPQYKSGVYQHVSTTVLGGHAVRMIGWGVENGVDYWLITNSWNEYWGDKGLFKILRGSNECGIEEGIVAGIPK